MIEFKESITDYTESEFLELLLKSEEYGFSNNDMDNLVIFFNEKIKHPKGSALLTHPNIAGIEDTSEAIIAELKRWYNEQGLPCFKK